MKARVIPIAVLALVALVAIAVMPAAAIATATRDLPDVCVEPGADFTVTVVADGYGIGGAVIETLCDGWVYKSQTGADDVQIDGNTVSFLMIGSGPRTITYTVRAPDTPGACCDIDGVLRDDDLNDHAITGDTEVCVCGDVPPSPEITEPLDGAEVCGVVTVTVVDESGEGDIEYCLIEYFNGTEWIEIANVTVPYNGNYSGDWDTSGLSPGEYTVRAMMEDAAGQTGTDEITVTIPPCCDADFVLELEAGWNLVSVPARINGSKNAVDVFNLSVSGFESCWYYDACTGNWSSNSDVSVEPCRGYWVLKENAETLCLDLVESAGPSDIPSQDLCEGWNLIGYTSSVAIDDGTAGDFKSVSTLEDTFAQLWTYSQTSGWLGYPSWGLDRLEPGEGAWILMTEDATMYGTPYV